MTTALRSVALAVDALDRAQELFAGVLGGTAGDGVVRYPPGVDLELWLDRGKGIRQLTFAVDDPDKTTHELVELGYVDTGEVLEAPAGYGGAIRLEPRESGGGEGSAGDEPPAPARAAGVASARRSRPAAASGASAAIDTAERRNQHGIRSLDHVCAPAAELEHSIAIFAGALGGDFVFGGDNDHMGTRSGQIRFEPGTKVELLHARRPGVPVGDFAARFPGRFHHMTMVTSDLPGLIERLDRAGFPLIDTDLDSRPTWRETFVRPSATFGALIQLVDTPLEYKDPLAEDVIDDILAGRLTSYSYRMRYREDSTERLVE